MPALRRHSGLERASRPPNTTRICIIDHAPLAAELTKRVCNVLTSEQIRPDLPPWRNWRNSEAELERVAEDFARYYELRGEK